MTANESIRNSLIDKILTINNLDFLIALDNLLKSSSSINEGVDLTPEQKQMLEMSEDDILNGRVISQDTLKMKTEEWLKSQN